MTKPDQFEFKLDLASGVPVYRQIIDQVLRAVATGALVGGVQLPTVRQASVDLAINPNTVLRAYRELELRGVITTQQGIGTFVTLKQVELNQAEREARLDRLRKQWPGKDDQLQATVKAGNAQAAVDAQMLEIELVGALRRGYWPISDDELDAITQGCLSSRCRIDRLSKGRSPAATQ